jgi:UDP-N-acetylglucosamine:LPS N-acetylglucosamine transferase
MAEFFNYPGEIFCVVCDADIARTWAPFNPKESKIKYFAPTERVVERLKLYGVKEKNIFLTGYPLPAEDIEILKEDLKYRILNLDPKRKFIEKYGGLIEEKLGKLPKSSDHLLTILFSIGGAGAQKEIGFEILKNLAKKIRAGEIKIIISAGIRKRILDYFIEKVEKLGLKNFLGNTIEIIFEEKIEDYFEKFNLKLKKTDILWTKPSELSFYSALGIPIIIAPPIGSQEEFNMRYLLKSGFGNFQENPKYTSQWLFDWLEKGFLAEAALEAFIEGEKFGTFKIKEIIKKCSGF